MKKDLNRQAFGNGPIGGLTTVRAASTGTTVNVTSVQYLQVGDVVDVLVASTGATTLGVVGATVTARVTTAGAETITIDTALAGSADTTYSVYVSGSYNNEMDGLQNIAGTSRSLHSINSATAGNEFWNAHSVNAGTSDAATAVAGESLFEQLADNVGATGNGEVEVFLTTRGIRRRLADTYQSQKRYNDAQAVNVHGGYSAIMVNEIPVVADDDCTKKRAFGFSKSALKWFEQTKPGWLEDPQDGQVFHLRDGATAGLKVASWDAWWRWYAALGSVAPNRTGRIQFASDETF